MTIQSHRSIRAGIRPPGERCATSSTNSTSSTSDTLATAPAIYFCSFW